MLEALFVYVGVGALVLLWVSQGKWDDEEHIEGLESVATVLFFLVFWPIWGWLSPSEMGGFNFLLLGFFGIKALTTRPQHATFGAWKNLTFPNLSK